MTQDKGDVKIRRMVAGDLPKVNEIDRLLFGEERVPTWPFSFEAYWAVYRPKLSFVAELEGEIVGFLVGSIEKEERSQSLFSRLHTVGPLPRGQQIGWVDMIGIRPGCQHRGIGHSLVEAFHDECKRNNATMRSVIRENDERLKNFVVALGFKKWEMAIYEKDS